MPTTFETLDALRDAVGTHLGWTEWMEVDQARVDRFADATGDHEWIHGYLTLALSNRFLPELLQVPGASAGVNYGTGTVRFPAPVPVGGRIRGGAEIAAVEEIPGGLQTTITITIELEGSDQPACVVESLSRWLA